MTKSKSITLSLRQLHELVDPVIPCASRDDELPVLTGVRIRSHGRWLVAVATDRFRLGMKRIERFDEDGARVDWPTFEALVPASSFRSIFATFKGSRGIDPELTLTLTDDGSLEVEAAGAMQFSRASIAYRLVDGNFPPVESVLATALGATEFAESTSFNPALMADFKNVGSTLTMRRGPKPGDPLLITDGTDFIGVLMPRAVRESAKAAPWGEILGSES